MERRTLAFSLPKFGTSVVMGIADFSLATLYILGYGLAPILGATILALGKITIAASQFFFGWISDQTYVSKWGRRKPYMLILSPLLGISTIFMLLPSLIIPLEDKNLVFIWLLVWYLLFNIGYGVTTPYGSWMAEQFSVDERPKASQWQNLFGMIGTGVMSLFSMLILTGFDEKIEADPTTIPFDFLISVFIFGIIVIALFYVSAFTMPTEPRHEIKTSMLDRLKLLLKNRNYLLVTLMVGLASIAWSIIGSLILLFMEEVLKFGGLLYIPIAAAYLIGILAFLYFWRKMITNIGKKKSLLYIFLLAIIALPFSLLGLLQIGTAFTFIYGLIFILAVAGALGGWYLLPAILYSDLAEDDEKRTGELKAGIYQGFPSIILNIFQAFGLMIMGLILELPNINLIIPATGLDISFGYVLWGPICAAVLIITYFYAKKFIIVDFEWENK
ncbi:MAG: MFS transporter [Promethearchaeota archaeon]|nr:MAG: MFS transporter [Candidatus Lokiarchaeota archaeon]